MAATTLDCKKRMTVWCVLAMVLVAIVMVSGYAIFESAGQGNSVVHGSSSAVSAK